MASAHVSIPHESRLDFLSQPKVDFLKFKPRKSVYWLDKLPPKTQQITVPAVTARQEELARPKKINKTDRLSPTWPVSQSAMIAVPSPRLQHLAQPKTPSKEWKLDRPVQSTVSKGALSAAPRPRTVELAKPKTRSAPLMKEVEDADHSTGDSHSVTHSKQELISKAELLAVPKSEHPQYLHQKSVQWLVPESAKNHLASDRVCQLAKHRMRKSIFEGYDPYRIPEGAKNAEASPRIMELCTPLPRKTRQRKI
ncbi:sperm microtubule associated protein 2 isoform X2 [Pleurodeles waltl]|uniref:sperm microtubule associated protein 2 isoform X2 n=1 Tax=Pleurodeles waltl TaxID=8319 RepID=UPI003709ADE1